MTLETKRITYEEYLKMPETKARYDIVDGVMITPSTPILPHQRTLRELAFLAHQFVNEHNLGEIFFAPVDVIVNRDPLRTRQPDLIFVSTERSEIIGRVINGPPDLVAEVLSPEEKRPKVKDKLMDYASLGVKECWLVSPEGCTVEILTLDEGEWTRFAILGIGDKMQSSILQGFDIEISQFFDV